VTDNNGRKHIVHRRVRKAIHRTSRRRHLVVRRRHLAVRRPVIVRHRVLRAPHRPVTRRVIRRVVRRLVRKPVIGGTYHRYLDGNVNVDVTVNTADPNYYVGDAANYKTLPNLIVIAEGLSTIYNTVFSSIPKAEDKGSQSGWDQLANGIQTYAKIRNFAVALLANHDKVVADLNTLKDHSNGVALSLDETLGFYDFRDRYNALKLKSASLTPAFFDQDKILTTQANDFSANIRNISTSVDYLLYVDDYLVKQTEFLRQRQDPGTPDSIYYIQTVDRTILLIPSIITVKTDIMKAIGAVTSSLYSIKDTRGKLDVTLGNMEKVVNGTFVADAAVASGFRHVAAVFVVLLLSVFL